MDTTLDLIEEIRAGIERAEEYDRTLDEQLIEAVRDHICPRCHYDTDDDGYCSTCGATCGRA